MHSDSSRHQEMGFGVAVALILDATLIRLVILPSTLSLLGQRSWYLPRWLDWLPHLQADPPQAPSSDKPVAAGAPSRPPCPDPRPPARSPAAARQPAS
jgi:RND superfamily putative drug exporter